MEDPQSEVERARGTWENLLRPALDQLAGPGEQQIAWLDRERFSEDELTQDFDHAYGCRWMWRDQGWLSLQLDELLGRIHGLLAEVWGPDDARRSDEAILQSPDWEQLRAWAQEGIRLMALGS